MFINYKSSERSIKSSIQLIGKTLRDRDLLLLANEFSSPSKPIILNLNSQISNVRRARSVLRPSPTLGSTLTPNTVALIEFSQYDGQRCDLLVTDGHGCAQNDLIPSTNSYPEAEKKIAFLGGSTIMGTGSRLPFLTIPALTEQFLRSKGQNVRCINFGVAGMTSRDSLTQLIDVVLPQRPDHVVFYTGWNCAFNFQFNEAIRRSPKHDYLGAHSGLGSAQILQLTRLLSIYDWKDQLSRSFYLATNEVFSALSHKFGSKLISSLVNRWLSGDPTVNNRDMANLYDYLTETFFPPKQDEHPAFIKNSAEENQRWHKESSNTQALANAAGSEYLRIMRCARDICQSASITFTGIFQPNLFWGPKILTTEEEKFLSQEPVNPDSQLFFYEYLKGQNFDGWIFDLSKVFEAKEEQVYLDTGHLSPQGNLYVAEKISEMLN